MASSDQQSRAPRAAQKPSRRPGQTSTAPQSGAGKPSGAAVASRAVAQLLELTGREAEGVTGLSRTEDGWTVQVEVLEARRIPDTTDLLALYEVDVDADGDLVGYRRVRRYVRGKPDELS